MATFAKENVEERERDDLDLADIQGNALRGYGYAHARHFALAVGDAAAARAFIGSLLPGAPGDGPFVTTAEKWDEKPADCLNVGITCAGLTKLGVPAAVTQAVPAAFQQGPAVRAEMPDPDYKRSVGLGDQDESAPEHWVLGGTVTPEVHILVSLYTRGGRHREKVSETLRASFAAHQLTEVSHHDADALPEGRVHFGYRDGIAQPRIGVGRELADMQPMAELGDFLLGRHYKNLYGGNYIGDLPGALADNATYGAFRILSQDVFGFEELLDRWAATARMDRELVAAKLMGRWRNGVPLTLSPDTPDPDPPIPKSQINKFDFGPEPDHPTFYDDDAGLRCPVGAHIRRLNPRGSLVMGMPHSRRIIRRAMPYGPEIQPGQQRDTIERGIAGYFICGDLEMQFEFIQRVWVNQDFSTSGLRGTREPIVGLQPEGGGSFTIRTTDARDPIVLGGMQNLVKTRGALYTLLPGIGGLRHLAVGAPGSNGAVK
jgi:deferrochelatase/peroxidase EfeB